MPKKKWTNTEVDDWWDTLLDADPGSYSEIKTDCEFTCFKLRFGMYNKRHKYIPERVRTIIVKGLRDFCALPSKDIYQGQYIDAFGFSCAIQDIHSAKMAYNLIEDKEHLNDTEIPKDFFTWFKKESRLTRIVTDGQEAQTLDGQKDIE